MKQNVKFISSAFCMFVWAMSLFAQTNYYTTTKTFYENGYTYQCDIEKSGMITLYNKNNKLTYTDQVFKSTGKSPTAQEDDGMQLLADDTWTRAKRYSIVNNAFTTAEKQRVRTEKIIISLYINPESGKVDEVNFMFHKTEALSTIPISVYRKIETELKNNIWYTPTTDGKKMNFILKWWEQEPK